LNAKDAEEQTETEMGEREKARLLRTPGFFTTLLYLVHAP